MNNCASADDASGKATEVKETSSPPALTILVTNLDRGGSEVQAVRLAVGLVGRGWTVRMASLMEPRDFTDVLAAAGVPVRGLGVSGLSDFLPSVAGLRRELRDHRPDVLLAFTYHANVMGKIVGRWCGVPVVTSIRGERFGGRLRERVEALTSPLAAATTTNSETVARALVARGVIARDRIEVVRNALAGPQAQPDDRRRAALRRELTDGGFVWLSVGRFESDKDLPNLFDAFARLAQRQPSAHLALVGYGSLERDVGERAANHPHSDRIRVLGRRHDVPDLLAACDGYVLSSACEGMPNALLEAMSAGRPVAATLVGGVGELVENGATGASAPPRDPSALADAMETVMTMSDIDRNAMADRGRLRVTERHGPVAVFDRWESLLREVARV